MKRIWLVLIAVAIASTPSLSSAQTITNAFVSPTAVSQKSTQIEMTLLLVYADPERVYMTVIIQNSATLTGARLHTQSLNGAIRVELTSDQGSSEVSLFLSLPLGYIPGSTRLLQWSGHSSRISRLPDGIMSVGVELPVLPPTFNLKIGASVSWEMGLNYWLPE